MILINRISSTNEQFLLENIKQNLFSKNLSILPTDTIYGLCALSTCQNSIEKIYTIKKRDINKNLVLFPESIDSIKNYAKINNISEKLIEKFLPGRLTLILPSNEKLINPYNQKTIGIRIPNHEFMLKLLKELKKPIFATSVNISGEIPINDHSTLEGFSNKHKIQCILDPNFKKKNESIILEIKQNSYNFIRYKKCDPLYTQILNFLKNY